MKEVKLVILFFAVTGVSCGDKTSFNGSSPEGVADVTPETKDVTRKPASLTWKWDCSEENSYAEVDDQTSDSVLYGPGPHQLSRSKFVGSDIHFEGQACNAKSVKRDILFVIDISSSMTSGSDPKVNDTCGRLDAIKKVIAVSAEHGDARFGIVTFASFVSDQSSQLFASQDELFEDLLAQSKKKKIEDIICDGTTNTNYEDGLRTGFDLLSANAEDFRVQELYLISDGRPVPSSSHGKAVAEVIREKATIATVMLGSDNDGILRNDIASEDQAGNPLHVRVENSQQLADTLATLSENYIESSELSFAGVGKEGKTIDISNYISSGSFSFDDIRVGVEDAVDGVAVQFNYKDRHGNSYNQNGKINWLD